MVKSEVIFKTDYVLVSYKSKTVDMAGIFTIYINQFLICSFNKPDFSFSNHS